MVHEVIVGRWAGGKVEETHRFVDDAAHAEVRRGLAEGRVHYVLERGANRDLDADWWLATPGDHYGSVLLERGSGPALDRLTPGARSHVFSALAGATT